MSYCKFHVCHIVNFIASANAFRYNVVMSKKPAILRKGEHTMAKFECTVCGYIYDEELGDPDNGIEPGTLFADLPDDWECPLCSVGKEDFEEVS